MAQYFSSNADTFFRIVLFGGAAALLTVAAGSYLIVRSHYETAQNVPREQPVPFSHKHHVGGLGLDCRYCHTTVEYSAFANIPPTKTCMNCHSEMWAASPTLEPVRESYRSGKSIEWTRVNDLPDYVYFNHSIHVHKGIGCSDCHGRVDRMALTWQAAPLTMEWCLDCHRHVADHIRPRDQVFSMHYSHPPDQAKLGVRLVKEYGVRSSGELTSCEICHR
ncbi:MAG: cytochrome c3 family protein [Bryobacteraceae bacterium]